MGLVQLNRAQQEAFVAQALFLKQQEQERLQEKGRRFLVAKPKTALFSEFGMEPLEALFSEWEEAHPKAKTEGVPYRSIRISFIAKLMNHPRFPLASTQQEALDQLHWAVDSIEKRFCPKHQLVMQFPPDPGPDPIPSHHSGVWAYLTNRHIVWLAVNGALRFEEAPKALHLPRDLSAVKWLDPEPCSPSRRRWIDKPGADGKRIPG